MILHYANLCQLAGGVQAFLIGSELKALTVLRDETDSFPVVTALTTLAADVASILPDAKISYAADWSEYFGYQPGDGSGDVFFHLDELWSSSDIDFIGIDNYMPVSDWRDGSDHLDAQDGTESIYDEEYLQANIVGGEGYDWYYASDTDRVDQQRTDIVDGAYGKDWVYRYKDLISWWQAYHYNRPGGVEETTPTDWSPESKPFWFTEIGCPAIEKGTNQPNVFVDPKSAESSEPHFSNGQRDDFIQRKYLQALLTFWAESGDHNPVSSSYGDTMVDAAQMFVWAWDARPYPAFPFLSDVWADGDNYDKGHWLNGRMGAAPLSSLVAEILRDYGFEDYQTSSLQDVIDGYVIERTMSARQALEPLAASFAFDGLESEGVLNFKRRDQASVLSLSVDELAAVSPDKAVLKLTRAQETDLPNRLQMLFLDGDNEYSQAEVEARKLTGQSLRDLIQEAPMVLSPAIAQSRAEISLHELWTGRETAVFQLPPSFAALEVADTISLEVADGQSRLLRIEQISDSESRSIVARMTEPDNYDAGPLVLRAGQFQAAIVYGQPTYQVLDLPLLYADADPYSAWLAIRSDPWPGTVSLLESADSGFTEVENFSIPAIIGKALSDLPSGPLSRFDYANSLSIELASGELSSVSELDMLAGANLLAIGDEETGWEIIQFQNAELTAENTWKLSTLLRGQLASDQEMTDNREAGSYCVLLDSAILQIPSTAADQGRERTMRLGPSHLDHGGDAYVEFTHTPSAIALRPLSPVHFKTLQSDDGLELSWIRRTRIDGDSWSLSDVPLGEEAEQYTIEILDGETIARTIEAQETSTTYTNDQQTEDFGSGLPSSLTIRVAQVSTTYGAGAYQEITFNV